jgi:hypothetical protein
MPPTETPCELSGYRSTPDYAETIRFLEGLAAAAPEILRIESFGRSGEGRDLPVVIVSKDGLFDPLAVKGSGRVVLLVQNCIHAGEPDGKDACLALLRDLVEDPAFGDVLDRVVLLVLPIYNVDGHERRSEFSRFNQNGPVPAGWRANGTNLNLNRDYLKADAPETRALLRLLRRWEPDFFVDDHVTDGADFQYDITFAIDSTPDIFPATAAWIREVVSPELVRGAHDAGHLAFPGPVFLVDDTDPARGLAFNDAPPRYSTGYMVLENRPALLVEMHMLKDYRTRVTGNLELLRTLLRLLHRDAGRLIAMNRDADQAAQQLGSNASGAAPFPLVLAASGETTWVPFLGYEYTTTPSAVSGTNAVQYSRVPSNVPILVQTGVKVAVSVRPPAAYLIPPPWTDVIDVLAAHGVILERTTATWSGTVERYHCSGMRWPTRPFEGRFPILRTGNVESAFGTFGSCTLSRETMTFPAGSAVVPLSQRLAKVAVHWLEPEAPDSALRWGFFHAIFEQKETGEGYVLEKLAAERLAAEPSLKAEFEDRLRTDPTFAADPSARLAFFYDRSPWYSAQRIGDYPIARLPTLDGLPLGSPATGAELGSPRTGLQKL